MASKKPVMDLERFVPALLTFVANRLSSTGSAAYMRAFGIGVMEFRVLVMLAVEDAVRAQRIADVIGLDKGAVSRTLKGLQRRGLIVSVLLPGTRRRVYGLSAKGRKVHDGALAIAEKRESLLLDGVSAPDRDRLIAFLHIMLGNMRKLKALADEQRPRT